MTSQQILKHLLSSMPSSCHLCSRHKTTKHLPSLVIRQQQFHSVQENRHSWSILKHIYNKELKSANKKSACLLLNVTDQSYPYFERYKYIWDEVHLRVAVDGSANCLSRRKLLHTADVISGDFDSIDPKLLERLLSPRRAIKPSQTENQSNEQQYRTPQVVETPCQKETDFTKSLRVVMGLKPDIHTFLALYHSDGSRIDHLFGLVNTLHLIKKDVFILNLQSNTISWLLHPGNHTILKPRGQELCSLIPFSGPTEVKTQGFRYNVNPTNPMSFSGAISTSNICQDQKEAIHVETNRELLWSIDLYNV